MEKYKLGEFVRFVNERREGIITKIIDADTIAVTDEDGFEIPVLAKEVTRVHGKSEISPIGNISESNSTNTSQFISKGIFLALTDDKKFGSVIYLNLLNTSSWQLLFTLCTEKNGEFKGEFAGILKANSCVQIYSASLNELDLWPKFHIQVLLFNEGKHEYQKPIIYSNKFKAKDFSSAKKHNEILGKDAWSVQLDSDKILIDPQTLKESFFKGVEEKAIILNPGKEVDLHIEKLRDDHHFLKPSEILDIQINHFKKSIDAALVHKLDSIVFIHGTGNGTLRTLLHKYISKHPQIKTFMDAQKEKFGYGATEIHFKS